MNCVAHYETVNKTDKDRCKDHEVRRLHKNFAKKQIVDCREKDTTGQIGGKSVDILLRPASGHNE